MSAPPVIVVGGGWAGLAAAVRLAAAGRRVELIEARRALGGRAGSFADPRRPGARLDLGGHLLMGCYTETRALLEALGATEQVEFQPELAVEFAGRDGRRFTLSAAPLPAPLHLAAGLLGFGALRWGERLAALRVGRAVRRAARDRPADDPLRGLAVADWLTAPEHGLAQPPAAVEWLWEPLCLSALNQRPANASAALFAAVLREAFFGPRAASGLGFPRASLAELLPEPAAAFLSEHDGRVRLGRPVAGLVLDEAHGPGLGRVRGVRLAGAPRMELPAAAVLLAVPPRALARLLPPTLAAGGKLARLDELGASPILTAELWFDREVFGERALALPGRLFHWAFRRDDPEADERSGFRYTLVASAAGAALAFPTAALLERARTELAGAAPQAGLAALRRGLVLRQPRATLAHLPGEQALRPEPGRLAPGLYLAGGWTRTGLPDTLEGAVRSGNRAAAAVLEGEEAETQGRGA